MANKFIHFRTQSSYSMLESSIKIEQLIDLTKNHGMDAVCLSDRGNLFASLEFAQAAIKSKIQPIHGSILNILFTNNEPSPDVSQEYTSFEFALNINISSCLAVRYKPTSAS